MHLSFSQSTPSATGLCLEWTAGPGKESREKFPWRCAITENCNAPSNIPSRANRRGCNLPFATLTNTKNWFSIWQDSMSSSETHSYIFTRRFWCILPREGQCIFSLSLPTTSSRRKTRFFSMSRSSLRRFVPFVSKSQWCSLLPGCIPGRHLLLMPWRGLLIFWPAELTWGRICCARCLCLW